MNQKVQDYLNAKRAQKRAEYDKKKSEKARENEKIEEN